MVVTCVAYGCTEWMGKDPNVSFHRFPHKNPEQLRKWIQAIRRQDWLPTKHSYICSKHFTESSFVVRPGKDGHRLYEHAIPSLFPSCPEYLQKSHVKRKSPRKRKFVEQPTHSERSPSKITKSIDSDHSYADDSLNAVEQLEQKKELQKQVKVLKQKVCRRDKKIKNIEQLFESLKEKNLILEEQHSLLEHNFGSIAENLFQNQLKNVKCTTQHGYHYSDEIKQFAITSHSPKAYDFVQNLLALPHPSSIRAWAASVHCNPGYLIDVMKCIGSHVQKKHWMSDVVLIVDAMALHKGTIWDPKTKQYVGMVDYGTAVPEVTDSYATEALVFMVSGFQSFQTSNCLCIAR